MISLTLRDCFEVGRKSVAFDIDVPVDTITAVAALNIVARDGAAPLVLASATGGGGGNLLIDFSHQGAPAVRAFDGAFMRGFCSLADGFLGFADDGAILHHVFDTAPKLLNITDPLKMTGKHVPAFRMIADGTRILVPLRDNVDAALSVLDVDLKQSSAAWAAVGPHSFSLNPADFPNNHGRRIFFDRAVMRDGQIILHSRGEFGQPRMGYRFSVIAQVDPNGSVLRRIVWQDYTEAQDEKKRGFTGDFTQSRAFFLAKGCYRPTDIWGGKTVAIDLETGDAMPFKLPRGLSDVTLLDHINGQWWGTRTTPDGAVQVLGFDAN